MAGRDVWRKADADGDSRKFGLGIFDAIARGLDIDALRPPPHPGGSEKKQIEARRLAELGAQRVCVPRVLGERASTLLLSNLDDTFAAQLRAADGDGARINALTTAVIDAIADAHARSAYLGQPLPRKIKLDDSGLRGLHRLRGRPARIAWLGRSARHIAHPILVVRAATLLPMLLVVAVLRNWLEDGEIELLRMMF